VNGLPAPCIPANSWMRAVPVPAGKSQVVLTFHSTYLALGAVISLATLALIVFLWSGAGQRKAPSTTDSNSPVAVAAAVLARCLTPRFEYVSIRPRRSLRTRPSQRAGSVRI